MKYKIIVDSSSNLLSNYIKDDEIGFEVVPLTIRVGDNVFVDNDLLNIDKMLEVMEKSSSKSTSACPSPFEFENSIKEASNSIIITISSKLSGCYNSAVLASKSFESTDKNVLVLDSKATAGTMILLVDKAYELMKKDIPWDEFVQAMNEYRDSLELLFVLNKYDNLVKNGRMSKAVAFIAKALIIEPLCVANNGEIKIQEKVRTFKGVLKRLVFNIGVLVKNTEERICVICHTRNKDDANYLKEMINSHYKFKDVRIVENRGLCAFYAEDKGLIVSF